MRSNDIHKLADEARFNGFHARVLAWCFIILIVDGYDLAIAGVALPSIMKTMGVNATTAGFMASSALFGMMVGAIGLGMLADRFGRRPALAISILLFSVFTAATGFTSDPVSFSAMRFLAGIGIGGAIPSLAAQMSEYAPGKVRSVMVTLMGCGYAVGSIVATLLGKQFLEVYGWQSVFIAAGMPVVLVPLVLKFMPESLSYLARQGNIAELGQIASRIEPGVHFEPRQHSEAEATTTAADASVGRLFRDGRGFSTLMLWVACFMGLFMTYALSTWLVKLMALAGYSLGSALNFLLAFNAGAIAGALGGGWLGDRFHIKWVLFIFYAMSAVSLTLLGYGVTPMSLVVALVGASTLGTQILCYAYAGQFYPAAIRTTGIGFASGIGRTGAILAPVVIGVLVTIKLPLELNFVAIAAAGAVGAMAVACVNHRVSASAPRTAQTFAARVSTEGAES
ncbi:MFS transporter [Cupriavidus sp. NPDC089707]|uniref:MFS transporter n=1 Tax=Cupriavidus sp. NPDC089707 TaxID=3363963 RepID=UPI0038027D93